MHAISGFANRARIYGLLNTKFGFTFSRAIHAPRGVRVFINSIHPLGASDGVQASGGAFRIVVVNRTSVAALK